MNPPNKKPLRPENVAQKFNRQAGYTPRIKPSVGQLKPAVSGTSSRTPLAPPHRLQQKRIAQPKTPAAGHPHTPSKASPVYRPQPIPKVLQTKKTNQPRNVAPLPPKAPTTPTRSGNHALSPGGRDKLRLANPSKSLPKGMARSHRPTQNKPNRLPVAPSVLRPQSPKQTVQAKKATTNVGTPRYIPARIQNPGPNAKPAAVIQPALSAGLGAVVGVASMPFLLPAAAVGLGAGAVMAGAGALVGYGLGSSGYGVEQAVDRCRRPAAARRSRSNSAPAIINPSDDGPSSDSPSSQRSGGGGGDPPKPKRVLSNRDKFNRLSRMLDAMRTSVGKSVYKWERSREFVALEQYVATINRNISANPAYAINEKVGTMLDDASALKTAYDVWKMEADDDAAPVRYRFMEQPPDRAVEEALAKLASSAASPAAAAAAAAAPVVAVPRKTVVNWLGDWGWEVHRSGRSYFKRWYDGVEVHITFPMKPSDSTDRITAGNFRGIWVDRDVHLTFQKNRPGSGYNGRIFFRNGRWTPAAVAQEGEDVLWSKLTEMTTAAGFVGEITTR